jgi:hypothetical protein
MFRFIAFRYWCKSCRADEDVDINYDEEAGDDAEHDIEV